MPCARWGQRILLVAYVAVCGLAEPTADATARLLEALDDAVLEADAKILFQPYLDNLKDVEPQVIEKVVSRQWWGLARDIVAKSHIQQVDLSFAVRKAVRTLKEEADELLRTLNPKYGLAQQVSPAFQWAQNDTAIFLTIKYTVRWNAPGALEVTDPSVNISKNEFNFTGLGKHSNNKYRYSLSLGLFDNVLDQQSAWSAASVGKLSVTLRKRWPRKWPRLLANKKTKIGNMHVWMEMQEKLDATLGGMTTVSNSPVTCALTDKLYCLVTDTCKKAANCSSCPGKTAPDDKEHLCTGIPTEKASLTFKDLDMGENEISGDVKIIKARNDFDVVSYTLYFGKDERAKLELSNGEPVLLGEAPATGADTEVKIPPNTRIPDGATHLLVFSKNEFGESVVPGSLPLRDAVLPKAKPGGVKFEDDDGKRGEVSGTVTVAAAETEDQLDEYSIHWGRSATRKLASASFIRDVAKQDGKEVTHYIPRSTKIPDGATHILVFSKNEHGEHPSPASVKVLDNTKPCLADGEPSCPTGVQVSPDTDPKRERLQADVTVVPATDETNLSHYVLYWGRQNCTSDATNPGAKLGWIKDVPVGGELTFQLADTPVPEGASHLLVFAKNKYGESELCVSTEFEDSQADGKAEL